MHFIKDEVPPVNECVDKYVKRYPYVKGQHHKPTPSKFPSKKVAKVQLGEFPQGDNGLPISECG